MKIKPRVNFDGPIPGENLTADTRNYPWHRPPEITDFNEAVEYSIQKLEEEREVQLIYSLLELEVPVALITSNFLMRGIARGKFPIDLALLLAGPVSRYIEIMAKDNGLKADMDTSNPNEEPITPTMLKLQMGSMEDITEVFEKTRASTETPVEAPQEAVSGLMVSPRGEDEVAASEEEQAAMLGAGVMDEEEQV